MPTPCANVECIGHLNLGHALNPTCSRTAGVILFARIVTWLERRFSSWSPVGSSTRSTNLGPPRPVPPRPEPDADHFKRNSRTHTKSVAEESTTRRSNGFGSFGVPRRRRPAGTAGAVRPRLRDYSRNPPLRHGRLDHGCRAVAGCRSAPSYWNRSIASSPAATKPLVFLLRGRPPASTRRRQSDPSLGAPDNHCSRLSPGP